MTDLLHDIPHEKRIDLVLYDDLSNISRKYKI